jgi:hypothetical protein
MCGPVLPASQCVCDVHTFWAACLLSSRRLASCRHAASRCCCECKAPRCASASTERSGKAQRCCSSCCTRTFRRALVTTPTPVLPPTAAAAAAAAGRSAAWTLVWCQRACSCSAHCLSATQAPCLWSWPGRALQQHRWAKPPAAARQAVELQRHPRRCCHQRHQRQGQAAAALAATCLRLTSRCCLCLLQ